MWEAKPAIYNRLVYRNDLLFIKVMVEVQNIIRYALPFVPELIGSAVSIVL